MASVRLKVSGRIDRAREERWDELWGPDAIAVAAAGREVVLASDELSRGVDCQRFVGYHYHHNHHHHEPPTKTLKVEYGETGKRSHQSYLKRALEIRSGPENNALRSIRAHCLRLLNLVHIIKHLRRECACP